MGRAASDGAPDAGPALGRPASPRCDIALFARADTRAISATTDALTTAVRHRLMPPSVSIPRARAAAMPGCRWFNYNC